MKRAKILIAIILLASLLLSSCGQATVQPTEAEKAAGTDMAPQEAALLDTSPEAKALGAGFLPLGTVNKRIRQNVVKSDLFSAKFEGDAVAGSGEAVDGVYRFVATETDGEAWHVKLECSYPTVAGRDYRVTYRFRSDVAGKVKFGDFQEFAIEKGENSVTGILIASGGSTYLDLQLGMLPPFTIDFTEIEVEEYADVVDYENALSAPVSFLQEAAVYEAHDEGYDPVLTRTADAVSVNFRAVSSEPGVWKSRLFIRTGLIPEPGVRYHIAADISGDRDLPFEVLFNNGGEEKGYGALYGQSLAAGETKSVEAVITGVDGGGELVLQFSLGEAPAGATVTIGNLRAETFTDRYANVLPAGFALDSSVATGRILSAMVPESYREIPLTSFSYAGTDTVYEGHDDGYVVELEENASSATLKIKQAPADEGERGVWKARLYAATGVTPEAGTSYRIAFDLASEGSQAEYEACFDGDYENAYGALYARSLTAGGTDHVELIVTPDVSHGPLTIRLQMGKTDSAAGNTVTLSNLSVEKLTPEYQPAGEVSFRTGGEGNVWEEHYDGLEQTLTVSGASAALDLSAPRSEGGVWSSKLFVRTGFTPEAGVKYRFSANVDATADTGDFEILYQNSGAEELYGGQWGLNGAGEYASEFRAPASGCGELVLIFQFGNAAAPNTITVSELRLCELSGGTEVAVEMPGFAYPEAGVDTTTYNSFDLEANSGAEASLTGDGSSATATVTTPGDDWNVKLYAKPGVELEAGESYTVSMDVTGAEGCTACYKNTATGAEDGFGTETIGSGTVTHSIVPGENGTLEILLKIGNVPSGTAVTVSNIRIQKTVEDYLPVELSGFAYPVVTSGSTTDNSFALEANNGAEASLTGDGSSATALVTTPGDDWHVKLYAKPGVTLEAGQTYTISMNVTGASGCTACYKNTATDNEEGFGTETIGSGAVTHTVTPTENGTLEILLKIGNVPADTAVTVSGIRIKNTTETVTPVTLSGFAYPVTGDPVTTTVPEGFAAQPVAVSASLEAYDGFTGETSVSGGVASLHVNTARGDGGLWSARFFVGTGITPEKGEKYLVTATLHSDRAIDGFEVLYSNGLAENDDYNHWGKGYFDGNYDLSVADDGTYNVYQEFTAPELSQYNELFLRFQIGNSPADNNVTVSNVYVGKWMPEHEETVEGTTEPNSFALEAIYGAEAKLTGNGNSGTATVTTPGDNWHVKLYAKPNVELEAGKTYKISMNVTGASGCTACYKNTTTDNEEGFGTETIGSGAVTHTVTPTENGQLEILLKIGNVPAGTAVTVSNVRIDEITANDETAEMPGFAYPVTIADEVAENSFALEANNGAEAKLSGNGNSATATVTTPGDDWHVKLYAKPNVELEAGKSYQISMKVVGAEGCTACYKNTATGDEEGFGTETIGSGTVVHTVTPTENGILEILLKIGNVPADTAVTVSDIQIAAYTSGDTDVEMSGFAYPVTGPGGVDYHSFDLEANSGAEASLTGDGSSAAATVTSSGDDWHIKLYAKPGVELEAGETYTITMNVTGAEGCTACYKNTATGDEEGFGTETIGSGAVTHTVTPAENGTLEILLKIGTVPAGGTVTVSGLAISRLGGEEAGDNLLTDPLTAGTRGNVNFWAHEDYAAALSGDESAAELAISAAPAEGGEAWKVKLFVETGLTLEEGRHYRISADVSATAETDYEICYNNGAEEKGIGALYGLHAGTDAQTAVFEATAESDAELILQFNLGWASAPCTVTVSNVKVEVMVDDAGESVLPDFRYDSVGSISTAADGGYIVSLDKAESSATLNIEQAPEERNPWNVKLNVRTGFTPEKDKCYAVSFDVDAAKAQQSFEVFYDGDAEAAYGQLTGQSLSAGKQTVSYMISPGDSKGQLTLQLRFGRTDGTDGNSYTISNVKIEEVKFHYTQVPETVTVTTLDTQSGYSARLEKTRDTATVRIESTPAEGREAWKSKLFVQTGVTLKAGQKYRIRMDVTADSPAPFEVCFNNGNEEKGLGAIYGLTAGPDGETVEYLVYPRQDTRLVIQISHGNCEAPNSLTLSGLSVEKAGPVELISDTIYTF